MKTLGATELAILRGFVRDVFRVIEVDDTGTSDDLYDGVMKAAEILGMHEIPFSSYEDEIVDEDYDEENKYFEDD